MPPMENRLGQLRPKRTTDSRPRRSSILPSWGMASLEVVLGILQSSNERREVTMSLQTPVPY